MKSKKNVPLTFHAELHKIGINPFVFIPQDILDEIFVRAQKSKGSIPIIVTVNKGKENPQTLLRYQGEWRLYINTIILKNSPKRIGEVLEVTVEVDHSNRTIDPHPKLVHALDHNLEAKQVFEQLTPSLKLEIVRYIHHLKTEESIEKNIERAIKFLLGQGSFVGRKPLSTGDTGSHM